MRHKTKISETQSPHIKNSNNKIHVALVYGGMSSEREVSIMSFKGINKALLDLGYTVTPVDMGYDIGSILEQLKPNLVFNGLYGTYGEDGSLPGLLEILGLKYTHSGVLASSIGMNKEISKKVFLSLNMVTPFHRIVCQTDTIKSDPLPRPYVIKPINQGSSVGVILAFKEDSFNFSDYNWPHGDRILVEEYIPGHELSVAIVENRAIGIIEIQPLQDRFSSYESKYTDGMEKFIVPAPIPTDIYTHVMEIAELAHKAIQCKSISRVDLRYNPALGKAGCHILEINTHPGMTPLSLVPQICAYNGISFAQIIEGLVKDGLKNPC